MINFENWRRKSENDVSKNFLFTFRREICFFFLKMKLIRTTKLDQTNIRGASKAIDGDVGNLHDPLLKAVCDMGDDLHGLSEVLSLAWKHEFSKRKSKIIELS